jgi:hypothetical protein
MEDPISGRKAEPPTAIISHILIHTIMRQVESYIKINVSYLCCISLYLLPFFVQLCIVGRHVHKMVLIYLTYVCR